MFEVEFYEDKRGKQPVKEALIELRNKAQTSKDAAYPVPEDSDAHQGIGGFWNAHR